MTLKECLARAKSSGSSEGNALYAFLVDAMECAEDGTDAEYVAAVAEELAAWSLELMIAAREEAGLALDAEGELKELLGRLG